MLNFRIFTILLLLAVVATYTVEYFGFAIAHSVALLGLAVLISPGLLIAFLDWEPADRIPLVLCVVTNTAYYFIIALLVRYHKIGGNN